MTRVMIINSGEKEEVRNTVLKSGWDIFRSRTRHRMSYSKA